MPAQYIYTHSTGSNVDLSARVRAYRTSMSANAEEGSTAISTIIVDDEESGIDIRGLRQFDWKESSESSNSQIIFRGWTADRDISRGPFKVQRSRQWSVNISDLNSALNRRIMRGADANRPAETDVARIQWAVSTTELNILTDSTYISTTGPTPMDANDYRNQRVFDIIDDCAQQSGKNYFLILNELFSPPRLGLFYDFAGSTAYSSSVRLTNVLADVDSTTTYAVLNDVTKLNRDPSRVYPTVIVPYNGGDVYINDPSISANFFPRDTMAPAVNVHSASVARTRGLRYLADIATEEDRITTGYIVPLARVNRLREGHTFQAKFSHLPGYTDWTWLRALKRTVTAISEEFYKVELECSPAAASAAMTGACSTVASGMAATVRDSSLLQSFGPFSFTPNTPSANPSMMMSLFLVSEGTGLLGGLPLSFSAPWTKMDSSDTGGPHTAIGVGYSKYTGGAPAALNVAGVTASGGAPMYRYLTFSFGTAANTPVQFGKQDTGGGTIVLGAAPTVGNILIACSVQENSAGTMVPTGFTAVDEINFTNTPGGSLGINGLTMTISYRCVEVGDSATWTVQGPSFPHWTFLSEWVLS